jgi:beta-mannosidase
MEVAKSIWIRGLASEIYLSLDKKEWVDENDDRQVFLLAEVNRVGTPLSTNTLFFRPAKELLLPQPGIRTDVVNSTNGFKITLRADKLAKNVFLSTEKLGGFFTDNYFHLLPGRAVEIEFQTEEQTDLDAFKQDLRMMSLMEAFGEQH